MPKQASTTYRVPVVALLISAMAMISCKASSSDQQNESHALIVDGVKRYYIVHVPPSYSPTAHAAVVLNFHGGGEDAQQQMALSKMNETSDAHGFLVVYPEGTAALFGKWRTWNAGSCCGRAQRENSNDVRFTAMLIDDLSRQYSIDLRRVFATGISNGGMMVYRLGCELADRIAAIAPIAATLVEDNCLPSRPISVFHIHGRADEFVPFEGGYGRYRPAGPLKSVQDTTALFVTLDECDKTPHVTYQKGNVKCESFNRCADNTAVTLCSVEAGGHTWPDGSPFPKGGLTTHDISANEAMWRFFEAHPMPH